MECFQHDVLAKGLCKACLKGICLECAIDTGNGAVCSENCQEQIDRAERFFQHNIEVFENSPIGRLKVFPEYLSYKIKEKKRNVKFWFFTVIIVSYEWFIMRAH
ncbi:hypothetical protein L4D06_19695 [Enterovibrio makurazakiensis]|uniref:hypothetical protein n=1 Tax=Enterovibrio makurazakiensis TaxID=2910232 RepID=UPI003D1E1BEB